MREQKPCPTANHHCLPRPFQDAVDALDVRCLECHGLVKLPPAPQGVKRAGRRSMMKCDECRRKKTKCKPVDRVWPGQKCDACIAGRQTCGPNRKFSEGSSPTQTRQIPATSFLKPSTTAPPFPHFSPAPNFSGESTLGGSSGTRGLLQAETDQISKQSDLLDVPPVPGASAVPERPPLFLGRVDAVRVGFAEANRLIHQLEVLDSHLNTISNLQSAYGPYPHPEEDRSADFATTLLSHIVHWTKEDFIRVLEKILDLLNAFELGSQEGYLLRLKNCLEDWARTTCENRKVSASGTELHGRTQYLRTLVVQRLIAVYNSTGDLDEAYRLKGRLDSETLDGTSLVSDDRAHRDAISFSTMAAALSALFRELGFDNAYRQFLQTPEVKSIPSIQIALLLKKPAAANFLRLKHRVSLEEVDIFGRNAIHTAAEMACTDLIELLKYEDPQTVRGLLKKRDMWKMTAVCVAACTGDLPLFEALVKAGADIRDRDGAGRSLLYFASSAGHIRIVLYLLKHSLDPNDDRAGVRSALHAAASSGHVEVCRILLEKGASKEYAVGGRTPAAEALEQGHWTVPELIQNYDQTPTIRGEIQMQESQELGNPTGLFSRTPYSTSAALAMSRLPSHQSTVSGSSLPFQADEYQDWLTRSWNNQ